MGAGRTRPPGPDSSLFEVPLGSICWVMYQARTFGESHWMVGQTWRTARSHRHHACGVAPGIRGSVEVPFHPGLEYRSHGMACQATACQAIILGTRGTITFLIRKPDGVSRVPSMIGLNSLTGDFKPDRLSSSGPGLDLSSPPLMASESTGIICFDGVCRAGREGSPSVGLIAGPVRTGASGRIKAGCALEKGRLRRFTCDLGDMTCTGLDDPTANTAGFA